MRIIVPMGGSTVIRRLRIPVLFALLLALGSGCSKESRIQIESDTCWEGFVDGQARLADCGDKSYRVVGPFDCVTVSKQTVNGTLRLRIEGGGWIETSEPLGSLTICN